jgi:hypothetical protein
MILQIDQSARQELDAETFSCDVKNVSKRYIAPAGASDTDGRNLTGAIGHPLCRVISPGASGIGEWTAMPITKKLRVWVVGLAAFSGCYSLQDCIDQEVSTAVNCHRAKMAWCACRPNYVECQENLWDFGHGFRQGYQDVLNGKNTCTPPFPPRCYWGICHQNDYGRCAAAAFFDGYHHGVAVALADGYGSYTELPYSGCMYRNCGPKPVQIDLEAYKASQTGGAPMPSMMDNGLPPIPDTIPGEVPAQSPPQPYSPNALPAPPEENHPSALLDPPLPIE